jgi:hypothetical protein
MMNTVRYRGFDHGAAVGAPIACDGAVRIDVPTWAWLLFASIVVLSLALDLWVHRGGRGLSRKQAIVWSIAWISVALLFAVWVGVKFGRNAATEFVTAYAVEKRLPSAPRASEAVASRTPTADVAVSSCGFMLELAH